MDLIETLEDFVEKMRQRADGIDEFVSALNDEGTMIMVTLPDGRSMSYEASNGDLHNLRIHFYNLADNARSHAEQIDTALKAIQKNKFLVLPDLPTVCPHALIIGGPPGPRGPKNA